jgi:hypothetical protein
LDIVHQKARASAPRQKNCWGEVVGLTIKGIAQRSGVGADGGGHPGEVDGVFDVDDLMVPEIFLRLWRKKDTIFRFLSARIDGINLSPDGASSAG